MTAPKGDNLCHFANHAKRTEAAITASRANGRKSLGPIPQEILHQVKEKAAKYTVRLLGLAEMRGFERGPGIRRKAVSRVDRPYPNLPPPLDRNFQDLARQSLELKVWERIRDAGLEHRWARNKSSKCALRRSYKRGLQGHVRQYLERGYQILPDSPAKFPQAVRVFEGFDSEAGTAGPQLEDRAHAPL